MPGAPAKAHTPTGRLRAGEGWRDGAIWSTRPATLRRSILAVARRAEGGYGLQARDEFGNDLRSGLSLLGERNALSSPQR
jgi:hypothetical protein